MPSMESSLVGNGRLDQSISAQAANPLPQTTAPLQPLQAVRKPASEIHPAE